MEPGRFRNRREAGRTLAAMLSHHRDQPDVLVLALPRGGVPVAYEVARALRVPLDVFLVRKLGVPGHEELAMGAVATGSIRALNPDVTEHLRVPARVIEHVTQKELRELECGDQAYRGDRPLPVIRDRSIV